MNLQKYNEESKKRIEIAKEISEKCPVELGREIIIVGSVSRNFADEDSDIEIEFLTDMQLTQEAMVDFIKEIGGTDIRPYGAPIGDGSLWIIFKYKDFFIEAGWQQIEAMQENINMILEGKAKTHDKLILASVVMSAIVIKDSGVLISLKEKLANYPEGLQKEIIENTISPLTLDLPIEVRKMLAKRGDKMPLLERMVPDMQKVLRILFAVNKKWEPDWKWTNNIIKELEIKPANLAERIDSVICMKDTKESLKNCFELLKDTFALVPNELELQSVMQKILNNFEK